MKLLKKSVLVGMVLATAMATTRAQAAVDLAAVGVLNLANAALDPEPTAPTEVGGKVGFGFGGLLTFAMAPMIGLQGGLLYVPHKQTISTLLAEQVSTTNWLQIPVTVRVSPIDLISVGVGFYYAVGMGDVATSTTPTGGTAAETTATYEASNIEKSDLGLIGSVALKLPLLPTLSLLADARYVFGLSDMNKLDPATAKTRDLQLLVGLNFGI